MNDSVLKSIIALLAVWSPHIFAATNAWQGGDGSWTSANWTVNGVANQTLATPPTQYIGDAFLFNSDDIITSSGRPALDGGSWTQTDTVIDLTGGGNNSGGSFGHNGTPSTVVLSGNASLILTGSGSAGTALSGRAGTMTLQQNAAVTCKNKNFEIRGGFAVTLRENSTVEMPYIDFSTTAANNALFTLQSGTATLTSSDPIRATSFGTAPGNRINFTGPAGSGKLISPDNSASASNLSAKLAAGFFCIDGIVVTNTSTFVGGRRFEISTTGAEDKLELSTSPPGGSLVLSVLPVWPGSALVNNPPPATGGSTTVTNGSQSAQTVAFVSGVTLSNLVVQLDTTTPSADLTGILRLEIYQTLNGVPFGGAKFADGGTLPAGLGAGSILRIALPSPVVLPRGTYALALRSSDASLNFKLSTNEAYSGGALLRNDPSTTNRWALAVPSGKDFIFAVGGSTNSEPPVPVNRPNIVMILADDFGWTDLQTLTNFGPNVLRGTNYGSDYYQTPNLARLAREGLSFTHCYAQPNCSPTRAALLSGQYASRSGNGVYNVSDLSRGTGTTSLIPPAQNEDVPSSTITSAEALRAAGYVTAHFGKYHVGGHEGGSSTLPVNQGFDWNFGGGTGGSAGAYFANGGTFGANIGPELDLWAANYDTNYINAVLWPMATNSAATPNNPSTLNGTAKHVGDAMGDAAIAFLKDHANGPMANRPFYLQFHTYEVHTPIEPRPDLQSKYNALTKGTRHTSANYAALVESQDQEVGRVLNYLDDPNGDGNKSDSIVSNTVVIVTSDNGGHEGATDNAPLRARKGTHYEGGIRVPLVVRKPGTIPAGQMTDTLVHSVDFYPTLLELAGASPNTNQIFDGTSFATHLANPIGNPRARGPIFYHFPGYLDERARPCSVAIKEVNGKRYKLIYNYDYTYDPVTGDDCLKILTQPWELYNVTDDLSETKNLIDGTYSGWLIDGPIADQLATDLHNWLTQTTPGWNARQPVIRSSGATVPHAPNKIPAIAPPSGNTFRVTNAVLNRPAQQVTLTWNSEVNFRYSVWASSDLLTWSELPGNTIALASVTTRIVSDPGIGPAPRYYRLAVSRP